MDIFAGGGGRDSVGVSSSIALGVRRAWDQSAEGFRHLRREANRRDRQTPQSAALRRKTEGIAGFGQRGALLKEPVEAGVVHHYGNVDRRHNFIGTPDRLARIFHTPNRCQDRPRTIDRRVIGSLPDMRAKSQTALSELAEENRPREKNGFALGFLVSRNRSIIHSSGAVWPLARMSCTPGRQVFAKNRLWLCGGVKCETSGLGACRACQRIPYLLREISLGWRESASTGSLSSAPRCGNRISPSIFRRLAAV